jgi:hypothetical protein
MGKSFKSETFSNSKALNLVFVFGPISVRSHLVLETWKLFTISFWKLEKVKKQAIKGQEQVPDAQGQQGLFLTRVDSF